MGELCRIIPHLGSGIDPRALWIADAHRDDGKRFVVRADEKLTAFLELESVIWACGRIVLTSCQDFSNTERR